MIFPGLSYLRPKSGPAGILKAGIRLLISCQFLACVLLLVQGPLSGYAQAQRSAPSQSSSSSEELVEEIAAACPAANRRGTYHSPRHSVTLLKPATAAQRVGHAFLRSGQHSLGHRLSNGLLAPLRC